MSDANLGAYAEGEYFRMQADLVSDGSVVVDRANMVEAINLIVDGGPFRTKQAYDILCGLIGATPDANGYVK